MQSTTLTLNERIRQALLESLQQAGNGNGVIIVEDTVPGKYQQTGTVGQLIGTLIAHLDAAEIHDGGNRARFRVPKLGAIECTIKVGQILGQKRMRLVLILS